MLAVTKVKMSDSENKSEQEHIQNFLHKTCKSCKTTAKRSTKKVCCTCKFFILFLLSRPIVVVFTVLVVLAVSLALYDFIFCLSKL